MKDNDKGMQCGLRSSDKFDHILYNLLTVSHQRSHLAEVFSLPRRSSDAVNKETVDFLVNPWFCGMNVSAGKCQVSTRGPTCKVDIIVVCVPAGGWLDQGAQVTLTRKELLPMVQEEQG